jgi:hypothetical protein
MAATTAPAPAAAMRWLSCRRKQGLAYNFLSQFYKKEGIKHFFVQNGIFEMNPLSWGLSYQPKSNNWQIILERGHQDPIQTSKHCVTNSEKLCLR